MKKLLKDAVQVIKSLGERIALHKAAYHDSIDPACRIHLDEYEKLQALDLPKLLAVVGAAKAAKKGQYRGLCADRLDDAIKALGEE